MMTENSVNRINDPGPDAGIEDALERLGAADRASVPAGLLDRMSASVPGPRLRLVGERDEPVEANAHWRLGGYGVSGLAAAAMVLLAIVIGVTATRPAAEDTGSLSLAAAQEDLETLLAFEEEFDDLFAFGLDDEYGAIDKAVSEFDPAFEWSPDETVLDLEFGAVTESGGLG